MDTAPDPGLCSDLTRLTASLHAAHAQGLLRNPAAVDELLRGIAQAISQTVEGDHVDPETSWSLRSALHWDYFEMGLKEALLRSSFGLQPSLCVAVREVVDLTLRSLRRSHLCD
ncbi:MAG: hypothetical protein SCH98_03485 [Deferrisomatales bacterium]|nr:hypothetical protein [Deferrisomatales bacterium]